MNDPTHEQRKVIEAYVKGTLSPLIESVLTKQLGMAAVFLRDELQQPTLGGGELGTVQVPREPTRAMLDAADKVLDADPQFIVAAWRAMLDAAGVTGTDGQTIPPTDADGAAIRDLKE